MQPLGNRAISGLLMSNQRAVAAIPNDFIEIIECLPHQIERSLGYHGPARFVSFHRESGTGRIVWTDGISGGMAEDTDQVFQDEIGSLAGLYGIQVGDLRSSALDVFVRDCVTSAAYFAPRGSAEAFLARRRSLMPNPVP